MKVQVAGLGILLFVFPTLALADEACASASQVYSQGFKGCFGSTKLECVEHNYWQFLEKCSANSPQGQPISIDEFEGNVSIGFDN